MVPYQLQGSFWGEAQAGDEQISGMEGLANASACCLDLQDLAGAGPSLADVLKGLFGPQRPAYGAPMADLVNRCLKRYPALMEHWI